MAITANNSQLQGQIEELRAQRGDAVDLDEIAEIVHSLMVTIEGDLSAADLQIHRELDEIMEVIRRARSEIAALQPQKISDEHIVPATDELGAVVAATENATGVFLDVAEQLEDLADQSPEGELPDTLRDISTRIFEASNFQDITGQRINKVVSALQQIESKVAGLAKVLEVGAGEATNGVAGSETPHEDESLLHGPSMPEDANSQDDIDAILASFD